MPSLHIRWINLASLLTITDNLLIVIGDVIELLLVEQDFLLCLQSFKLPLSKFDVAL